MAKVTAFRVGHCTHPSCMALKGSGWKSRCFPSRAYLIETAQGLYLWDTGYANHFHDAAAHGVYQWYPRVTPVTLQPQDALLVQLQAQGIAPRDIHTLVLSHFHADHVAGLRDFPHARLLCSASGWEAVRQLTGLAAVRRAFLPGLMPPDIEARLQFVEQYAPSALPQALAPFTHGHAITGHDDMYVVPLPGHAVGHLGAFVREDAGWTLLASDAAWAPESFEELRGPSELSFLVQHDRRAYYETLHKLHALHHGGQARIHLTHASDAADPEPRP